MVSNDSKILSFDVSVINSMRIIPFTLTIFGWDFGEFLNNFVQGTISFVLDFFIFPINSFSQMYNELKVFWADFPDKFCFYGMKVEKITLGTAYGLVKSDIPYTT